MRSYPNGPLRNFIDVDKLEERLPVRVRSYAWRIDAEFDIPQYDVSGLIRAIHANNGRLPASKRVRYGYLPDVVLARIEAIVQEAFRSP
jgi:hypothetical protein